MSKNGALALVALTSFALAVVPNARAQAVAYRLPADYGGEPTDLLPEGSDFNPAISPRQSDDWLGRDKAYHVGATFGIALGTHVALNEGMGLPRDRSLPVAAGTALAVGFLKEYADANRDFRPYFSWRDLAADALGAALAVAVGSL